MTVIITCGLRQEWCDFSQFRMEEMGIVQASKAKRINLDAQDIVRKMCKSMKVSTERSRTFRQVRPGKTWQISASDLFLENSDHDVWGWSSPDNIFFLDFWRDFEPSTRFVLVYGSLAQYAAFEMSDQGGFKKNIDALSNRWERYHEELLRFYHENVDNCILINIARFDQAATEISRGLNNKFETDTRLINTNHALDINPIKCLAAETLLKNEIMSSPTFSELENSADVPSDDEPWEPDLVWKALQEHEQALIQVQDAKSALKNVETQLVEKEAWFENEIKDIKNTHEDQLNTLQDTLDSVKEKLLSTEEHLTETKTLTDQHESRSAALKSELMQSQTQLIAYEKELIALRPTLQSQLGNSNTSEQSDNNELLLLQLTQVQEELNYYFEKYNALAAGEPVASMQPSTTSQRPLPPKHSEININSDALRPTEYIIDLRKYVNGEGWHSPEMNGRWAGLDLKSTVKVRPLNKARHKIEMTIIDAMSLDIVKNMKFKFEGQELKPSIKIFSHLRGTLAPLRRLKASVTNMEKPYPMSVSYTVPANLIHGEEKGHWIQITVPGTETPSDKGLNDYRDLSICVQTIKVTALD